MKRFCLVLILFSMAATVHAQDNAFIIRKKGYLRIMPVYQNWTLNTQDSFSQISVPLFLYYPMTNSLSFTVRATKARARGDSLATISGPGVGGTSEWAIEPPAKMDRMNST